MEELLNQVTGWSLFGFTMLDILAVIFAVVFNVKKTNKTLNKSIEILSKKELPSEIELDIKEHISSETRSELAEVKALLVSALKAESYILQTFQAKNWLAGEGIPREEIEAFIAKSSVSQKAVIKLVDKRIEDTPKETLKEKKKIIY